MKKNARHKLPKTPLFTMEGVQVSQRTLTACCNGWIALAVCQAGKKISLEIVSNTTGKQYALR